MESRCIFKINQTGLTNSIVGYERKRSQRKLWIFGLNRWWWRFYLLIWGGAGMWEKLRCLGLDIVHFWCPIRHLSGKVEQAIRHGKLNFRREVQTRDGNLCVTSRENLGTWVGKRRNLSIEIWGTLMFRDQKRKKRRREKRMFWEAESNWLCQCCWWVK